MKIYVYMYMQHHVAGVYYIIAIFNKQLWLFYAKVA